MNRSRVPKAPPVKILTWLVQFYDNSALMQTRTYPTRDQAYRAAEDWRTADGRWSEIQCVEQDRKLR